MTKSKPEPVADYFEHNQLESWNTDHWWKKTTDEKLGKKKLPKYKKIILIVLVILTVSFIYLSTITQPETHIPELSTEETTRAEQSSPTYTSLQQQLKDLNQLLLLADPAIKEYPFPEVSLDLAID